MQEEEHLWAYRRNLWALGWEAEVELLVELKIPELVGGKTEIFAQYYHPDLAL